MARTAIAWYHEVRDAALFFILDNGRNVALWQECRLIWGSRASIDELSSDQNQMVVFGVVGKLLTPENTTFDFRVQYVVEAGTDRSYKLQAVLSGGPDDAYDEIDIFLDELSLDEGRKMFQDSVQKLTEDFKSGGFNGAKESFLTL